MEEGATETLPGPPPRVVHHRFARVNGVRLHYVEAGAGPVVVLLHGFPEFWYSWRKQLPALAAAGFRALAPDLRGYNLSDKPAGVHAYRTEMLTADVAGLIAHAGGGPAAVVGHDWGGAVAWLMPLHHPAAVSRLAILNAPHPAAFVRALRTWEQLSRSWYMFLFQLPGLPEEMLRSRGYAFLDEALLHDARPGAFTPEDVRLYKRALSRPGALTAGLNYYRAAFRGMARRARRAGRPIAHRVLTIWGDRDRYLGPSLTEGVGRWAPNLTTHHLPEASHWVQNDAPDEVNRLLIDFLSRG
jgi:pimeloyl-ACP methyl ester carboxylesterase